MKIAGPLAGFCIAVAASLVVVPSTHAQTMADIAHYSGPDRTQRLIDGAKKEGTVTLYSSATVADSTAITDAFTKKYDVPVRLWRGSS